MAHADAIAHPVIEGLFGLRFVDSVIKMLIDPAATAAMGPVVSFVQPHFKVIPPP